MERAATGEIQKDEIGWKSSEVRERQILFELEKKAKVINIFSELIGKVENTRAPFEIISDFLENIYKENPEIYQKFKEYCELAEEYKQLEEESKRKLDLRERANVLYSDEHIQFFWFLSRGVKTLKKKYNDIKEIKKDKEAIKNSLEKALFPEEENKLERDSIKDIKVSAFGIDVVVEKDYFKILIKELKKEKDKEEKDKEGEEEKINNKAFHKPNSFFNIYKEGCEDWKENIGHERIHNLLEGFFPPIFPPSLLIKNEFLYLDKQDENERIRRIKQTILSFSPSQYVDLLHEEMLAVIGMIENLFFPPVYFINEKKKIGFSTASTEISRIVDFLGERIKDENNQEIKEFCAEFPKVLHKEFSKTASIMRRALFIGNELGQKFIVHSLLSLIKPTKFNHIEIYLKSQYGKERYEGYSSIYSILFEKTISLKGLSFLLLIKEDIPENLKERLKKRMREYHSIEHSFFFPSDVQDIKSVHLYLSYIREFYSYLGIQKFSKKFEEGTMRTFLFNKISNDFLLNFKNLPDFFIALRTDEKLIFEEELKNIFSSIVQRYLSEKIGVVQSITQEFIKAQPFWKVLVDLKLDAVAQKGLDEHVNYVNTPIL